MTLSLHRCVFSGILTVWGILLTYFYFSGRVASYLHPSFHGWALGSGLILLALGVGMVFLPGIDHACNDDGCEEPHAGRSPVGLGIMAVVLIVPVIVATIVSPSQFGATAVLNRGFVSSVGELPGYQPYVEPALPTESGVPDPAMPTESFVPRNEAGQIKAEPIDLLYAAEEPSMRKDFENQEVEMIGQYMPAQANNAKGDRFNLVKMFVMCCAADARPVAVAVQAPPGDKIPDMSWVRVVGKASFPVEGGRRIPIVIGESVTPCDPPDESFIYN